MSTLITDAFGGEDHECQTRATDIKWHASLVYGSVGWTDVLSDESIDALVGAGAIVLDRTTAGPGFSVRLYVSQDGRLPDGS